MWTTSRKLHDGIDLERLRLGVCLYCRNAEAAGSGGGGCPAGGGTDSPILLGERYILLRARKSPVHHAFEHGNQRVGGKRVVYIGEALLPALGLQKRQ